MTSHPRQDAGTHHATGLQNALAQMRSILALPASANDELKQVLQEHGVDVERSIDAYLQRHAQQPVQAVTAGTSTVAKPEVFDLTEDTMTVTKPDVASPVKPIESRSRAKPPPSAKSAHSSPGRSIASYFTLKSGSTMKDSPSRAAVAPTSAVSNVAPGHRLSSSSSSAIASTSDAAPADRTAESVVTRTANDRDVLDFKHDDSNGPVSSDAPSSSQPPLSNTPAVPTSSDWSASTDPALTPFHGPWVDHLALWQAGKPVPYLHLARSFEYIEDSAGLGRLKMIQHLTHMFW